MLSFALALALVVPGVAQDKKKDTPPDPKRVEAAVETLEQALKAKEPNERAAALRDASEVVHADVIKVVARGFKDDHRDVRAATIEALRFMDHPDALELLHKTYKKDKSLAKDEELFGALLRAIGQHGSKDSIKILADNPFKNPTRHALTARIFGLGNIRDERSVEELMGMMKKVGKTNAYMEEFQLSLMVLTGTNQGKSRDAWTKWWNDNKKTFEVPEKLPVLPEGHRYRWDRFWGLYHVKGRNTKREDRGDDPEDD